MLPLILPDQPPRFHGPPLGALFNGILWFTHPIHMDENKELKQQLRIAEIVNGRAAMLGIIAALGAYACTGQIVPGLF